MTIFELLPAAAGARGVAADLHAESWLSPPTLRWLIQNRHYGQIARVAKPLTVDRLPPRHIRVPLARASKRLRDKEKVVVEERSASDILAEGISAPAIGGAGR